MKRASQGRQAGCLSLSLSLEAELPTGTGLITTATSAQFKAIFKEAPFDYNTDVKELLQSHDIFFSRTDRGKIS